MTFTYSTLKTQVQNYTENDSTEFLASFDTFIELAEFELSRDLDSYGFVYYTTITATSATVPRPTGEILTKSVHHVSGSVYQPLLWQTDEFIRDYWPNPTATSTTPVYYGYYGASAYAVAPTPTSATLVVSYVKRPDTLTSANPTNWWTDNAGNALFYKVMEQANFMMKEYQAAQMWAGMYQSEIAKLNNTDRRTRRDDQRSNRSPDGADNTINGGN